MRLERYAIEPIERARDRRRQRREARGGGRRAHPRDPPHRTRTRHAALALPSSAVIAKRITLPAGLLEEDYEVQVETEASQYIPFSIDEVNLDFQILGPAPQSPEDVEVLLAASRKEKVDDRVAIAEMAGLKPIVIDVEPYAARASIDHVTGFLPNHGEGMILAVFDVGQNTTNLTVVLNGQTIFERDQTFGGNQLTADIVRLYGLTLEEAELKKKSGDLPDTTRPSCCSPSSSRAPPSRALAAVLLHLDAVHPRRPHLPRRRLRRHRRPRRSGGRAHPGADRDHEPVPGDGDRRRHPASGSCASTRPR